MPKKVDLDVLQSILRRNQLEMRQIAEIMEDVNRVLQEEAEQPKEPPVKKQFVMLLSDPENKLAEDMTGWVFQLPEDTPPPSVLEKLAEANQAYSQTPKGRRMPPETVGEACEALPPKICRESQLWIKTREPVWVVRTNNKLPKLADT